MNFYKYINDEKLSNVLRNIKTILENDKNINNDDDIEWIKKEMYGYNIQDSYPEYRILAQKLCFDIQTEGFYQNKLNRDWEYLLEDIKDELNESNDVKENTINYTVNETKENDFIEELKEIIKKDKEQPDMLKNLAINELDNIKSTKSEEERIVKWNKFRSMVADWTTILTPLTPFLIGLGI